MIHAFKYAGWRLFRSLLLLPVAVLLAIYAPDIGTYEGAAFPVVTDFHIDAREPSPEGHVAISATFTKARACKLLRQEWDVETLPGLWAKVRIDYPEDAGNKPTSRVAGHWQARWVLAMAAGQENLPLRAFVFHQCWGPLLWETVTEQINEARP